VAVHADSGRPSPRDCLARLRCLERWAALAGAAVAAGALLALLISEQAPLFGFMEHGYRVAIVLSVASEAVATARA
jgi:hypothetical protein